MTARHGLVATLILSLTAIPASPVAGQDFENVQIQTEMVAPGVYMLMGQGGNLGVSAGTDAVFLVDDQFAPLTKKIEAAIAAVSDQPIEFVLNTHWHFDHTGGNENLGKGGALIVAHDNVRKRMSVEQFMEAFDRTVPASPKVALPVVTFSEEVTFHINDDEIHVFHVPHAHTDGDAIIHFSVANVVHMGDTFFNGFYPFIDVGSGGSIDGMITAADRVLAITDAETKIIPGHGALSDKAGLSAFRDMLRGVRETVAAQIAMGKSQEQVIAAKPTAAWDAEWGGGFLNPDQFTGIVYSDLSRKR